MAIVIVNTLAYRIKDLADKNHRTFNEQLELMIETFETMNIKKLSYLPRIPGCHSVPVVEISGAVIQGGA
jgi:hypothetical protein